DEARKDLVSEPVSYWVNTSGNEIIYDFLKRSDSELKDNFTKLVNGEAIKADIYPEMTYRELEDDEMVYSYLLTTGYLKALGKNEDGTYNLVIPNKEVRTVYEKYFSKYTKGLKKKYSLKICRSLFEGDGEKAEELINDYLFESVSSMDYSEAFYHGTLNSLFDGFASLSNREFGYGRPDIVVLDNSVTVLIEIKKTKDLLLLSKAADEAIEQIKEKKYIEGLNSYGYKNIRAYGVSFCKKRCCVKMLNQ
ncbi:MAG: PD-(D/E)XK nuclease domain-containing protein, partial [Solobacterium sp.]|nr:PD-(D/E)XK nuclease domain-containing protein [Solobacterium sp.]